MPLEKPVIKYLGSTRHSIIVEWTGRTREGLSYRVQIEDNTYDWITKYWGLKTKTEVKGLGPEQLYNIRVGVSEYLGDDIWSEEVWSETFTSATKFDLPWTFYLLQDVERGAASKVEEFLKQRDDCLDIYNRYGDTPLISSIKGKKEETFQVLLKAGADVSQPAKALRKTPLMVACFEGYKAAAEALVGRGVPWSVTDSNQCQALHYAVDGCQLEMVRYGVECGADLNAQDKFGWTPLMRAVLVGADLPIIKFLVESGADMSIKDQNKMSAFGLAKLLGDPDMVEFLKEHVPESEEEEVITVKPMEEIQCDDSYEIEGEMVNVEGEEATAEAEYTDETKALIEELQEFLNKPPP